MFQSEIEIYNSVAVSAELFVIAERRNWGFEKRLMLSSRLELAKTIEITSQLIPNYLTIESNSRGRNMGKNDIWIAATAISLNATLITTDQDFRHLGGTLLNLIEYNPENFEFNFYKLN